MGFGFWVVFGFFGKGKEERFGIVIFFFMGEICEYGCVGSMSVEEFGLGYFFYEGYFFFNL